MRHLSGSVLRRCFVCSVGLRTREMCYEFGGKRCVTRFAPVATAVLREPDLCGSRALVVATREAYEGPYRELAEELRRAGLEPQALLVPDGRTREEIFEMLRILSDAVEDGEEVVVDVTHGLRHLPFVYLVALVYMTALKGIDIAGIYYWPAELVSPPVPLIDLTSLFNLLRLYQAVETSRRTGDFRLLEEALAEDRWVRPVAGDRHGEPGGLGPDFPPVGGALKDVRQKLGPLARSLASGLPLEAGIVAEPLLKKLATLEEHRDVPAVVRMAVQPLRSAVERVALPEPPPRRWGKKAVRLSRELLEHLLGLAEWYIERGNAPAGLLVMRETLVSAVVLACGGGKDWLAVGRTRREAEAALNAAAQRHKLHLADAGQDRLGRLWDQLSRCRNEYAHAGFRTENVDAGSAIDRARTFLKDCRDLLKDFPAPARGTGRLLVAPLGLKPGALYTALRAMEPHRLAVVVSRETEGRVPEVLERAGMTHLRDRLKLLRLDDPHRGFREVQGLLDDELHRWFVSSEEVVVSLTGGTTVMEYVVERLAACARRLGVSTTKVAAVDTRSAEEQQADPYVMGEIILLDGAAPAGPDAGGGGS
ncbi:MAG TPA: hypothetical protein DGR79_06490 [Clostridiales bacterium]|nr:hypothetical protein [Clostridiales bacterium]